MDRGLIDQYTAGGAKLRRAVEGLTRQDLLARPGPGQWSIQEVVIHLADSDASASDRMKRILTEDNPALLDADETTYTQQLSCDDQSLDDALVLFEVGRRQCARILRQLPDAAFLRRGLHHRRGEVTVGGMVADDIHHLDHHLEFIYAKRAKLNKPLV